MTDSATRPDATYSLTQSNENTTHQLALAYNFDSPDAVATASNSSSTDQFHQIGSDPTQLPGGRRDAMPAGTIQSNSNETVQIAIAANDHSEGATAGASNINLTAQVNLIDLLGTNALKTDDGSNAQINSNTTLQFDLAINLDSPDALAVATSTNTTTQANIGGLLGGDASDSNHTVQVSLGLNIDSPGARAIASSSSTTVEIGGDHGSVMSDISLSPADLPGGGSNYNSVNASAVSAQILAGSGALSLLPATDAAQIMAALPA
jgi:hypothetical protein